MALMLSVSGCATTPHQPAVPPKAGTGYVCPPESFKYRTAENFFAWPVRGNVASTFGARFDRSKNEGIDILAEEGSDVRASRSGRVVFADEKMKGFGKTVILDHGDRYQTVYAYNSLILVKVGDFVTQSGVIAKSGKSGRAKEPSLHFEIRKDGAPENPFCYLSR